MDILQELPVTLGNLYLQELAKREWIKHDLVEYAQEHSFTFDDFKLDGVQATQFAQTTCAHSWTEKDERQARAWADVVVRNSDFGQPGFLLYFLTKTFLLNRTF